MGTNSKRSKHMAEKVGDSPTVEARMPNKETMLKLAKKIRSLKKASTAAALEVAQAKAKAAEKDNVDIWSFSIGMKLDEMTPAQRIVRYTNLMLALDHFDIAKRVEEEDLLARNMAGDAEAETKEVADGKAKSKHRKPKKGEKDEAAVAAAGDGKVTPMSSFSRKVREPGAPLDPATQPEAGSAAG